MRRKYTPTRPILLRNALHSPSISSSRDDKLNRSHSGKRQVQPLCSCGLAAESHGRTSSFFHAAGDGAVLESHKLLRLVVVAGTAVAHGGHMKRINSHGKEKQLKIFFSLAIGCATS